jgi:hypothetical protein
LYGQVATKALEEQVDVNPDEIIEGYKARTIDSEGVVWVSRARLNELKARIRKRKEEKQEELTPDEVKVIITGLPGDQMLLAQRVLALVQDSLKPETDIDPLVNKLASDPAIGQIIR